MRATNSTSSASSINATSTSSKRMSGLISGLDTDTLVKQLTSGTQSKIDKQMQSKQIALWKQQSYRQVTTALSDFKAKYFSSSTSSANISSANFFNSTSINNTSSFLNISGNASVAKNMVVTSISQLAQQASFVSNHNVSNETIGTGTISSTWAKSLVSGNSLTINYDGKDYAVKVNSDFAFSSTDPAENTKALAAELNAQIAKTDGLKGNVKFDNNGQLSKTGTSTADIIVSAGSTNLLKGLGLTVGASGSTSITGGPIVPDSLFTTQALADSLSGSTVTFSLNGLTKNITFKETDKSLYSDVTKLKTYLQNGLNSAFGTGKIEVDKPNGTDDSGTLSFKMTDKFDTDGKVIESTDVLSIASSDVSGILGANGALHVYAGESNRINTNKTFADVQVNLKDADKFTLDSYADPKQTTGDFDAYGLTVNGKKFTFKSTDTIANIISTVNNDADANVTLSYSETNNTFSVTSKSGGSTSKVDIADSGLAKALFGSAGTDYTVQTGQDAKLKVSFDGNAANAVDIVRSDNKFTLDGVNFSLLGKTDATVTADTPIKFTVDNKTDDLYTKIKGFVDDYNALIVLANGKVSESKPTDASYPPLTDAQKADMTDAQITAWETNAKKGLLKGDSILNSLSLDLRHSMTDMIDSMKSSLYDIGISSPANDYAANGKLTIDETKLKNALNNDPDKVSSLFTGTDGVATRMQAVIDRNIKTTGGDGILIAKAGVENSTKVDTSSITKSLAEYDTQIKNLKALMETQQEQYYAKFTKLEQYLSTMNSQSNIFTSNTTSS